MEDVEILENGIIKINNIKYKEIPAPKNGQVCKSCEYLINNKGKCMLDICPCLGDTILKQIN